MKVIPSKIPKTEFESIRIQIDEGSYFYDTLHKHPEIQLTPVSSVRMAQWPPVYPDQILAIEKGGIVERGTLTELIEKEGRNHQLHPFQTRI